MGFTIVTGANRGIGLALATALKNQGNTVLGTCRKVSPALEKLDIEVVSGVDVSSSDGIDTLVKAVGDRKIDLLINNAGILHFGDDLDVLDSNSVRKQFEVNALAPLMITAALRKQLADNAKVALITSRMGSIDDNTSGRFYGYRMSKAALNMAGKSLANDLKPDGVAVALFHPGMVKTEMVGDHGQIEPEDAAKGLLDRIAELNLSNTGGFWHANGEKLPW